MYKKFSIIKIITKRRKYETENHKFQKKELKKLLTVNATQYRSCKIEGKKKYLTANLKCETKEITE